MPLWGWEGRMGIRLRGSLSNSTTAFWQAAELLGFLSEITWCFWDRMGQTQ
jgi:hypothetical protein